MSKKTSNKLMDDIKDPTIRTMNEVQTYFPLAKTFCRPWHDNVVKWRNWYNFKHYSEKALPYEERYPDPTPTNVVDLAIGILVKKPVEWSAQGWEPDIVEEEDSSNVEKYLVGTLYVNMEREQLNIPYEIVTHMVRDGASVIYSVWDQVISDAVMEDTEEGPAFTETPVRLQVIDPLQFYVLPGGPKRWQHMFRVWEMSVYDIEMRWGVTLRDYTYLRMRERMTELVEVKDYWRMLQKTKDGKTVNVVENALMAGREVIRPLKEMEGYQDLPYTLGFFKPTSRNAPAGWHSIIRPLESTVTHLEKAINRRSRQIFVYTSLPIVLRTMSNRRVRVDPALGTPVHLSMEESIEFPTWPGNPPDVEHQIGFLRARLQQAGFTDVMYGEGGSDASGYGLSQLSAQNQIRLAQPIIHLEMLWTEWARKVLRLTSYFTEGRANIRVYGQLKGQNFAQQLATKELEHYMVRAKVKPVYPGEDVRNHAMGTQTVGTISDHTRLERYYDIDQPDDERDRLMDEATLKHPVYVQFQVIQRLMRLVSPEQEMTNDELDAAAAQMALAMMMGGQAGPGGGGTGAGQPGPVEGGPAPMQPPGGMPSPSGQLTPQEQGGEPPGQGIAAALQRMSTAAPKLGGEI